MGEPLLLVRDVLDKQIYDTNALKLGKVDGIMLLRRAGRPPRVLAIESSMPCALRRVWRPLGDWFARFQHWIAPDVDGRTIVQFSHVVRSGIDVEVDIDGTRTKAFAWETWLAQFVDKIPGGKGRGEKGE